MWLKEREKLGMLVWELWAETVPHDRHIEEEGQREAT